MFFQEREGGREREVEEEIFKKRKAFYSEQQDIRWNKPCTTRRQGTKTAHFPFRPLSFLPSFVDLKCGQEQVSMFETRIGHVQFDGKGTTCTFL